jgi:hypothetical protein
MAKEVLLRDVEVLELYKGEFETKDKPGQKMPYYQLRCYQMNQQSDYMTVVKVTSKEVSEVSALVGSTVSLLTDQRAFNGKISYHYLGVM